MKMKTAAKTTTSQSARLLLRPSATGMIALGAVRQVALIAALWLVGHAITTADAVAARPAFTDGASHYLTVEVAHDRITLIARDAAVHDILQEIAHQMGLVVIVDKPIVRRIDLELDQRSLHHSLRRILRRESYALHLGAGATSASPTPGGTLWVFSNSSTNGSVGPNSAIAAATHTAIEQLRSQLLNGSRRDRLEAIKGLRRLNTPQAIGPLRIALSDQDQQIWVKAIYAMTAIGGDEALQALAAATADDNVGVREAATYALGMIGGARAAEVLEWALFDSDHAVREAAIEAFADIGGDQSARALGGTLYDENVILRAHTVDALGEIGGESSLLLLQHALLDRDRAIRNAAAGHLANMPPR